LKAQQMQQDSKMMNKMKNARHHLTSITSMLMVALLVLFITPFSSEAENKHNVVIITSTNSSFETLTAGIIQKKLESDNAITMLVSADDIATSSNNNKTLYVAIGDYAINKLQEFDENAFALRLTSNKVPGIKYTSAQSDFLTIQPACRNIQLIRAISPDWDSVAVLSSHNSLDIASELTRCAIQQNINLKVYAISDESDLLHTLETAIENNRTLLAITDPLIYNSHSVKNILLTAYRHRKPVIGYSESFVRAGAVAAVYTSPRYVGETAARIVSEFLKNNWQFDKNVYLPNDFSVSINRQVATSLELKLPRKEAIKSRIEAMDKQP
jgi:ABC-type uncharacterized transport system substrate-binding protein